MHNYYKYNFVPPDRLYARIELDMRSYFATGSIDNLQFPIWTEDCLLKFRKSFLPIKQSVVCIKDGQGKLPEDFDGIREAWSTYSRQTDPFIVNGSFYYPKDYDVVTVVDSPVNDNSVGVFVETYNIVRKSTAQQVYQYSITERLIEGIVYPNSNGVFEVVDKNTLKASFNEGVVHIIYYGDGLDSNGFQLIPDDFTIQEYIRKYITYMLFLQVFNQTTDETFNQVLTKLKMAEQAKDDAFIKADIESKKQTTQQRIKAIEKSYNRNSKYRL